MEINLGAEISIKFPSDVFIWLIFSHVLPVWFLITRKFLKFYLLLFIFKVCVLLALYPAFCLCACVEAYFAEGQLLMYIVYIMVLQNAMVVFGSLFLKDIIISFSFLNHFSFCSLCRGRKLTDFFLMLIKDLSLIVRVGLKFRFTCGWYRIKFKWAVRLSSRNLDSWVVLSSLDTCGSDSWMIC